MSGSAFETFFTDKNLLCTLQYSDDAKLEVRITTHRRYSTNRQDWPDWLLGLLDLQGDERALDIGTGSGNILLPLARKLTSQRGHVTALDISPGVIENARRTVLQEKLNVTYVLGDAQQLPFPDGSYDLAMANHMLYHVPDISRAIEEIYRVLRPGGVFLAATNSASNMRELAELHYRSVQGAGMPAFVREALDEVDYSRQTVSRFTIENGMSWIVPVFGAANVALHERHDCLQFHEAEPLQAYYASGPIYHGTNGVDDPRITPEQWQRLYDYFGDQLRTLIAERGVCEIGKLSGAFVARKA